IFHGEFFPARGPLLSAHVDAFLAHFETRGWIECSAGELRATEAGEPHLAFLAEQMRAVLESYFVAVSTAEQQAEPVGRRTLERRIAEQFERAELIGETGLPEANNPVTFANAVDLMIRRGMLAAVPKSSDRRDPLFGRGPNWPELARLRERLATALRPR
ncbi:MAG TPA: hypothetical protein VKH41_06975, partial [Myxococcota bacterium]|nr:hypothetical protein [Myxococcota bacterium]